MLTRKLAPCERARQRERKIKRKEKKGEKKRREESEKAREKGREDSSRRRFANASPFGDEISEGERSEETLP
jgi:hypothetical protein